VAGHQLRCTSPSLENALHLYEDDFDLRAVVHRARASAWRLRSGRRPGSLPEEVPLNRILVQTWGMFSRYPRIMHPVTQWAEALDLLAAIITALLIAVIYLNRVGPGRIVLVLAFTFFVPGRAIVANWPRMARWSEAAIPVVISLAITVLVATVSLWAHLWHPVQIFEVEAWLSLAALVFSIMRRHRLGLVWSGHDEENEYRGRGGAIDRGSV
jgi:hypothetical protein